MKHWLRLALCAGALAALLTCGASAAENNYTTNVGGTVTYNGNSSYTASYTGTVSGKQYALLVVKGTPGDYSISEDTIMYIDQKAATGNTVTFENFIPRSTPNCVVLLGGVFEGEVTSPVVLGTLIGQGATIEVPEVSISFTGTTLPTLSLETADGTSYSFTEQDGNYSVSGVPDGTYTLTIRKKSHMPYEMIINVANGILDGEIPAVNLLAGDTDENGFINSQDLGNIIAGYLKDPSQDERADIDENGAINSLDLGYILANYLKDYGEK